VPSAEQLAVSDETWDMDRWGSEGNLWLPHVYSPAQNPGDSSGVNQFGRWAYGPWFWPPTLDIDYPPIDNPYHDPACDPDEQWCEPPLMPGTPFNSMGMEAFNDTPVVNGTAYPTVMVEPKAYRFRILNAASDRFFNLSLYVADASGTEVELNPAEVAAALTDPTVFPTPVAPAGPDWIQIGTEGGFLPAPVVIPPHPITWVNDPTVFNAGNVDQHSLLIAPAERADVIVDFSRYAGQTLILYNDAPAAFPARDPRYDYYTGNPDLRDTGGAPSTLPGYGPNIRTVMQVVVGGATTTPSTVNLSALQAAFGHQADGSGVFESGQHPIIVGQGAYNSAYGSAFRKSGFRDGFARITDFSLTFSTLIGTDLTVPFQPKAIQDEMGEAFEKEYGRMSGNLGLEVPLTQAGVQQNLILYPYVNPASEVINATLLPKTLDPDNPGYQVQPIADAKDGTQIWKITHNGVDTHPIHFHLFDVQLLNRVGWDGIIRPPEANELGWKDTLRVSPLEDTIVALRPIIPVVPFEVPNSVRPLNPMMPLNSPLGFNNTDANANPTDTIINALTNFGQEYVWHCHILSHEEMDMMRPISVAVPPKAPGQLIPAVTGNGNNQKVNLHWRDNSANETGFIIQRATNASFTNGLTTFSVGPDVATYSDPVGNTKETFFYRVFAANTVGYNATPGYAVMTVNSGFSNVVSYPADAALTAPTAPGSVNATAARQGNKARVTLTWTDVANESGYRIQRATDAAFTSDVVTSTVGGNTTTFNTGNVARNTNYYFRIQAYNSAGSSGWAEATPFPLPTP
jgi:FtsP/CotA-like multicopper oxidase with cupredoxin domain